MWEATLDADFGCAELSGLQGFFRDLLRLKKIGVTLARTTAEGAELASHETDVGEINIAVYHVGDEIAAKFRAQEIGSGEQAEQIITLDLGEKVRFFARQRFGVLPLENFFQRRSHTGTDSGRNVVPIECGKLFELRDRTLVRHRFLVETQ